MILNLFFIYRVLQKLGEKIKSDNKRSRGRRDMQFVVNYSKWHGILYDTNTKLIQNLGNIGHNCR